MQKLLIKLPLVRQKIRKSVDSILLLKVFKIAKTESGLATKLKNKTMARATKVCLGSSLGVTKRPSKENQNCISPVMPSKSLPEIFLLLSLEFLK